MDIHDTVRVRHPRDTVEYRLGTVTAVTYAPYSTYAERYQVRFPNGLRRTYPAADVVACTRDDDRAALVAAVTDASHRLRDACRIAHDHDDSLSAEITATLAFLLDTAGARLGVTLNPDASTTPATTESHADGARP
ncbi:hypothetical protein [Dactylosporangium sp. NPDC051484]|uniref:hypothetical protein n=1 Tax=Dactylosporangium sp. NPDC051484 TaxID=3154942 RepID=UPI00344D1215